MKLFQYIGGADARIFGFEVFDSKNRHPWVKASLYAMHRWLMAFQHWKFWAKQKFITKPHLIDTKMDPSGFMEVEDLMFHACFQILGDYVENQLGKPTQADHDRAATGSYPYKIVMHRDYRLHNDRYDIEGIDLWLWYKEELPRIEHRFSEITHMMYVGDRLRFGNNDPDTSTPEEIMTRTVGRMLMREEFGEDSRNFIANLMDEKLEHLVKIRRCLSI